MLYALPRESYKLLLKWEMKTCQRRLKVLRFAGVKRCPQIPDIKLQEQPFQLLRVLLDRPGEVVTWKEVKA